MAENEANGSGPKTNPKKGRPKSGKTKNRKTVSLSIDPHAWILLEEKARSYGMTRSDLVERIATGQKLEREPLGESSAS